MKPGVLGLLRVTADSSILHLRLISCKGNIILEVASANATRTLLERIQANVASAITKDLGFYLGILPENLVRIASSTFL